MQLARCVDVGSPQLPGTPEGCSAIARVPHLCEQWQLAIVACPLSCGRCPPSPPPLPPAPPGGYSPPPTVEELIGLSVGEVLSQPLGDLSVLEPARLEQDPRPLRNFELLGLGVLLGVIALRLLWRLKRCLQPVCRWLRVQTHAVCFLLCCHCACLGSPRGGDDPLLAPGAARSDGGDAAQAGGGGVPFVRRQVSVGHLTTSQLRALLGRLGIGAKGAADDRDGLLALLAARGVTHVNADGSPLDSATRHV